ncbi:MAG: endo-1,4-beta-xylanase [Treponema sp.]|jgi:endo-1,4-beta-xylanase|nr:endo-1,4-beta-xylanase [Treponema sp.]
MFKKIFAAFAVSFVLLAASCSESEPYFVPEEEKLWKIYENDFLIGNIVNSTYLSGMHFQLLKTHYNAVTCENDMKPNYLAPARNSYTFSAADNMVNNMIANGMTVIGHTLVWHSQSPAWLTSGTNEQVRANLVKYITDVAGHFRGRIHAWDVVNEAFLYPFNVPITNDTEWKSGLRTAEQINWNKASTDEMTYIELAFRTARTADPGAILYYNDFDLNNPSKAKAVRNMVNDINTRWLAEQRETDPDYDRFLVEGVGLQTHYGLSWWNAGNFNNVKNNIENFLRLGIEVSITEMDITIPNNTSSMLDAQALVYAQLFDLYVRLNEQYDNRIKRVTMWGIDDNTSWRRGQFPCLFNENLQPKKAFYAVSNPQSFINRQ